MYGLRYAHHRAGSKTGLHHISVSDGIVMLCVGGLLGWRVELEVAVLLGVGGTVAGEGAAGVRRLLGMGVLLVWGRGCTYACETTARITVCSEGLVARIDL